MNFNKINKLIKNELILNSNINIVKYGFTFVSLYPPYILNYLKFTSCINEKNKKILIKQSYLILTWFYYLSHINQNTQSNNKIKIATLPLNKKIFTSTRAPIAHKTWSKEQFQFQFYKFKVSFKTTFRENNDIISLNSGLLCVILTKKLFPQLETNLLFLKNFYFIFLLTDKNYFNYNRILMIK